MDFANYWFSSGAGGAGYEIEQSLRFDGSAYLSRSLSTTANYTMSVWVKFAKESNTDGIIGHRSSSSAYKQIFKEGSGYDSIGSDNTGSTYAYSNNKCRDFSGWYHIVASHGSSVSSKIYINGEEVSYRLQPGSSGGSTSSATYYIGALWNAASPFNGYMAEVQAVESTELPTAFGEYDDNGVWRPIAYSGSYGSSGYYLKFDPTATNGIGHDHSGNGNHFTASGFTTSGTGTDVMSDTPTNNFATLNPLELGASSFSEGNLFAQANGSNQNQTYNSGTPVPTILPTSGKWYVEFTIGTVSNILVGINYQDPPGAATGSFGTNSYYFRNGEIWINGSGTVATVSSYGSGDVIGVLLDADAQTIRYSKNGTLLDQARSYAGSPGADFPQIITFKQGSSSGSCTATVNYGQRAFNSQPSGYNALCTANLPAPDIADGSQYFDTKLYTGNSSTNAITGFNFSPDFVWLKSRSHASDQVMYDIIRGTNKELRVNTTNSEWSFTDSFNSFNSNGFTLGSDSGNGNVNLSSRTYVGWAWDAGGSGSSNTSGSITSTVSANPTAGFSIVTYTGNGTAGATIGHGLGGLGVAPSMIITKRRDNISVWNVYHSALGATKVLYLNQTSSQQTDSSVWNNTSPSSTVFTVGTDNNLNTNTGTFVAYCFAEVEGYSKFGSFTGNGSTDGPFIATSFSPAFLIWRRTDSTANWFMVDAARNTYNPVDKEFYPDQPNAEYTFTDVDFLSNGFKLRASAPDRNANGGTFIYMCFASNPFGGSGVSPATAR